ncbi:hypothetical protein DL771_007235 [Monosporascus sp. 5C6A]|nr:hypothetical protein DL771_007235 [Monosporascus sp. 5C6A]
MRTTNAFATFLALFAGASDFAQAECYKSGIGWGDRSAAYYHAGRACRGFDGQAGVFQSSFAPGEIKRACVTADDGGMKYEFGIRNQNERNTYTLDPEYCYRRLADEINCDLGGAKSADEWEVFADPNEGTC